MKNKTKTFHQIYFSSTYWPGRNCHDHVLFTQGIFKSTTKAIWYFSEDKECSIAYTQAIGCDGTLTNSRIT